MRWHPISTAPRDDSEVLVYKAGVYAIGAYYGEPDQWVCERGIMTPTHWQPLPPPPEGV